MSEEGSLVIIKRPTALDAFTNADTIRATIARVQAIARDGAVSDVDSVKARKEIASVAYRVAQTKSYIDGVGKELVAEMKELPRQIDAARKEYRDRLDALRDEIRAPLDAWEAEQAQAAKAKADAEAAAKARAEWISRSIAALVGAPASVFGKPASVIKDALAGLELAPPHADYYDDRVDEAAAIHAEAVRQLAAMLANQETLELAEQARRDRAIAEEATERARKAAESQIIDARLAQERAERERADAERKVAAAAEQAARDATAAAEKAARDATAAAEQAARQEREKIAAEQAAIDADNAKRTANVAHRKKVNNAALSDLLKLGLTREQGIAVVKAIASGAVAHVSITY